MPAPNPGKPEPVQFQLFDVPADRLTLFEQRVKRVVEFNLYAWLDPMTAIRKIEKDINVQMDKWRHDATHWDALPEGQKEGKNVERPKEPKEHVKILREAIDQLRRMIPVSGGPNDA